MKKIISALLIILIITLNVSSISAKDFFSPTDEYGEFNSERVLEEALDKQIALLEESYKAAQIKIADQYVLRKHDFIGSFSYKNVGSVATLGVILALDGTMGKYDVDLTKRSIEIAMEESGSMDYAFVLSAISLKDEYTYENVTYSSFKKYINSDSIIDNLCSYTTEEAYGILNEDGTITECTKDDKNAKIYIKTNMRACSVLDVFRMIELNPDEYSTALPNMTNYEVAVMKKHALKTYYAPYYDFGTFEIDYTLDNNYRTAMMSDLEYLPSGMEIPLYHQNDYPDSPFGSSTVAESGCGPTSMAMITSYMTKSAIFPNEIASKYGSYYVKGKGSSHSLFSKAASDYGFHCKSLKVNAQIIINELAAGHPVIITVGKGKFTKGGHIMVIRGLTDEGEFLLNDPNKKNYVKFGTDKFTINEVMLNAANGHAYAFYY